MDDLKKFLQEQAEKTGVSLLGFGNKERFDALPERLNPFTIFPEGRTVIMLGKRICRGALRGVEEGTNFGDYNLFGSSWLEDEFLAMACYDMAIALESKGWEAVPVFPNPSELAPMGVSVAPGRAEPNVFPDFAYAAVACGLCEIGRNGILLSPQFGSRQRFHMIITDAELEPTPLLEQPICDGCMQCAASCPLGAISETETREIDICGKKMSVALIDYEKCRTCKNGACANRFSARLTPDRIPALCNRTCISHLEQEKRVGNLFEKPFRQNDAWAIAENGESFAKTKEVDAFLGGAYSRKEGK